jgi:hypothetical protein
MLHLCFIYASIILQSCLKDGIFMLVTHPKITIQAIYLWNIFEEAICIPSFSVKKHSLYGKNTLLSILGFE